MNTNESTVSIGATYTTQMDAARKGIITPEMKIVAQKEKMTEEELREYGLEGEIGTLTEDGITFPKKIIAKYRKGNLQVPTITDFDLIMGNGISNTSFIAGDFTQDKLFGFCSDIDNPNLNLRLSRAKSLVESYNEKSQGTYELQRDKDKNKVYCLVRRVK